MEEQIVTIEEVKDNSSEILDKVRELITKLDSHAQYLSEEDFKAMVDDKNTHLLIARLIDTHEVVGMVTLIVYRIPYKWKAQLEDLVVDERMRGKGIGSLLINASVSKAQEEKVKSLNLTSSPTRESANKLYQKLGFERRDTNVYRKNL